MSITTTHCYQKLDKVVVEFGAEDLIHAVVEAANRHVKVGGSGTWDVEFESDDLDRTIAVATYTVKHPEIVEGKG